MTDDELPAGAGTGRSYWERNARRYDLSMKLFGGPLPRAIELSAAAVRGKERVLEVAAGTGLVTAALATSAQHVVATDYAAAMVKELQARVTAQGLTNVECQQADVYALPFEDASFDAVVAANVLHLFPDLDGALAGLLRVLRPGGMLIVPTYCHAQTRAARFISQFMGVTGFPGQRRLTLRSLCNELSSRGLRVEHAELIPGLLPIGFVAGSRSQPRPGND